MKRPERLPCGGSDVNSGVVTPLCLEEDEEFELALCLVLEGVLVDTGYNVGSKQIMKVWPC